MSIKETKLDIAASIMLAPTTQEELAIRLSIAQCGLSVILNILEEDGLIRILKDDTVKITSKGIKRLGDSGYDVLKKPRISAFRREFLKSIGF